VNVPLDTKGQTIKSTAGSLLVGDGAGAFDTKVSGSELTLIAGSASVGDRFLNCSFVSGRISMYRAIDLYSSTGALTPMAMSVEVSPVPNLRFTNMPIAPNSGILDSTGTTGGVGQVLTANGSGGWAWNTPATANDLAAVLSAGNSAGSSSLNMNNNDITGIQGFTWNGNATFAGTTQPIPTGSIQGSIPVIIGSSTYYIPYYN
jgi:hypothetical protein